MLDTDSREVFVDFCMGNRGLQITYDPFFKKIFTEKRPQRLLSQIMGQTVSIVEILPRESYRMSVESSFIFISLDIFRKIPHNELTQLDAWLYFLSSDNPADINRVTRKYPEFCELYQEIIRFRYHPKEMLTMFSEAIKIMDDNAIKLMIDDMREELAQAQSAIRQKDAAIHEKDAAISEKDRYIAELEARLGRQ